MPGWLRLALIGLAGGAGALARYGLAGWVQRAGGDAFPWGTLTVNMLGCFLFGLVWALGGEGRPLSSDARLILLSGFMGALTTFSTFASDTNVLIGVGRWPAAALNVGGQVLAGLLLLSLGLLLGKQF